MNETGVIVITILGYVIGAIALYWIIRVAVRHGIRDTQPKPPAYVVPGASPRAAHLDADGL